MQPLRFEKSPEFQQAPGLSADESRFVNFLRFVSMGCRAKPRAELFEACALLQGSPSATQEAYAEALMRCLNEALGKSACLRSPGTAELSFDEAWLLQLGRSCARGDGASQQFLLSARVARSNRRLICFLMHRVSECFSLN